MVRTPIVAVRLAVVPRGGLGDRTRFALAAIAIVLVGFTALEWAYGWTALGWQYNHGDLAIYTDATRRLFAGGSWYLERQLGGPYLLAFGDVLYPPVAALFFAPWLVLPGWTFVVIPAAIVGWFVASERPSAAGWIAIALCLLWPPTGLKVLSANPNVWVAAFVALGLRYRWPGALVLLKPSFLPLALIGIRTRGWWLVAGALALLSLPFLAATLAYPGVVLGARGPESGLLYSLADFPTVLIPVIARAFASRTTRTA